MEVIADRFAAQGPRALELRESTARQRITRLKELRRILMSHRAALARAFAEDFGKPTLEVDLTEVLPVLDEIRAALCGLRHWMRPRSVAPTLTTLGTSGRIVYQPRGRCLIIGPWNYPVSTLLGPLVSAVASGNTAVLKPSEFTPAVNAVLAEIIAKVFDPAEVTLIEGGVATAQALLDLPFDHIFFTGSLEVGKLVMAAAARHLASVTLELGGKSPVIVDETADLRRAAEVILWGKLVNAGQTCIAPDTLFVHANVMEAFLILCREIVAKRFGADQETIAVSPDLARMIHQRHATRIAGLIDEARAAGAEVVLGGDHDATHRYVAPTLLTKIPETVAISREEIFGPVMPVIEFTGIDDVIARLNIWPKPLTLYVWSRHRPTIRRILAKTSSGGVVVNHCLQHFAHTGLPFGGVNASGIGSAHGFHGFKAFSHERAVLRGSRFAAVKLFFPPYTQPKARLASALISLLGRI